MKKPFIENLLGGQSTSRKLTLDLLFQFNKDANANGHQAWKDLAKPDGPYWSLKSDIRLHNQTIRAAWQRGESSGNERLIELHADYKSTTLIVKHVNSNSVTTETAWVQGEAHSHLYKDEGVVKVFGNMEVKGHLLENMDWTNTIQLSPEMSTFNQYIDSIVTVISHLSGSAS